MTLRPPSARAAAVAWNLERPPMKKLLDEFKDFINQGNIIELAVAFIFGLAVKALID